MHQINFHMKNNGFMLIELMLATALGLLILTVLIEIYLSSHQNYQQQFALYQNQENARTAIDILTKEISKSGYIGCAYLTKDFPITAPALYSLSINNKLTANGTSVTVRYMAFPGNELLEPMQNFTELFVNQIEPIKKNTFLIISDCKKAEIFQVSEVIAMNGMQKIISTAPLHDLYDVNAEVGRFEVNEFYIKKTKRHHQDGSPMYALLINDIHQTQTELVEDIQTWHLKFSISQEGHIIELPAEAVQHWDQVRGVAIELYVGYLSKWKNWYLYIPVKRPFV